MEMYERPLFGSEEGKASDGGRLKKLIYEVFEGLSEANEGGPVSREEAVTTNPSKLVNLMEIADNIVRELFPFGDISDEVMEIVESLENPVYRAGVIADRIEIVKECGADDELTDAIGNDSFDIHDAVQTVLVDKYACSYCQEIVKVIPDDNEEAALCVASAIDQYLTLNAMLPLLPTVDEMLEEMRGFMDDGIDDYFADDDDDDDDYIPPGRAEIFGAMSIPDDKREDFMAMAMEKDENGEYVHSIGAMTQKAQAIMLGED